MSTEINNYFIYSLWGMVFIFIVFVASVVYKECIYPLHRFASPIPHARQRVGVGDFNKIL